ncbi:myosin regulatory light chain, smooth muscle isoform X1 [Lingula anatina]|uniref:Myosin regulatory light chain, smooth muscle isoform X1 n=1 Tax=Lingula anatina TaxID=7574 RepID=A0A1S3I6C6_LINAN|nr:myosin regulatory light chain, smooth muscle isoform X1 [Lingula anatina]|eukprot:XP_013392924.1 myosin regulatory light chain, smooth muscle isoform X1 [Lingula anatina]
MASKARVQREKEKAAEKKAEEEAKDAGTPSTKKRAQRTTSNVFSLFSQSQIQEFKEAFTMIDQNRDGFIDVEDLKDMYASLGRTPSTQDCEEMLKECVHGQMNFTAFLTLFGQKLHGTDPEGTIMDAFKMFDGENVGYLEEEYFKDLLMNVGDQYNQSEINQTWKELPLEGGRIDYVKFTKILKGSNTEDVA